MYIIKNKNEKITIPFTKLILYAFIFLQLFSVVYIGTIWKSAVPFLVILTVLIFVIIILKDFIGAVSLVFSLYPFSLSLLNFEIGMITFNPFSIGLFFLGIILIIRCILGVSKFKLRIEDFVLIAMCISFFYSTLQAQDVVESGHIAYEAIFLPVLSYFIIKTSIHDRKDLVQIIVFFVVGVSIFCAYNSIELVFSPFRRQVFQVPPISAATISIAALFYFLYSSNFKFLIRSFGILVNGIGLLISFTRVYLILLLLSYPLLIIIQKRKAVIAYLFILIGSFLVTMFLIYNYNPNLKIKLDPEIQKSYKRLINWQHWEVSFNNRGIPFKEGFEKFKEKPLFGNGFSRGETLASRHNFHIECLEYGGIFGYGLYVLYVFMHIKRFAPLTNFSIVRLNLLIIICILINSISNSIVLGFIPGTLFMFMGLNEGFLKVLETSSWKKNINA
jgi:hypothetical protein